MQRRRGTYIHTEKSRASCGFLRIRDTKHAFEFVARPLHGKFNDYPRPVVKIIFATRYIPHWKFIVRLTEFFAMRACNAFRETLTVKRFDRAISKRYL